MRRELEEAAREGGGHRSSSPIGSLGRGILGPSCESGNGGGAYNDQDDLHGDLECGGTTGYYSESLPNSVHLKFVG